MIYKRDIELTAKASVLVEVLLSSYVLSNCLMRDQIQEVMATVIKGINKLVQSKDNINGWAF